MTKEEIKKAIEVMQAYVDGKVIQYSAGGEFTDANHPCWDWNNLDYRIKPESKLRPYANAEEFLKAQKEHGSFLFGGIGNHYVAVKEISGKRIWLEGEGCSWEELCDGTPCGIPYK